MLLPIRLNITSTVPGKIISQISLWVAPPVIYQLCQVRKIINSVRSTGNYATLFTTTFSLDTGVAYSIFVTGNPANQAFRVIDDVFSAAEIIEADTVTVTDTVVSPAAIRFVNATPRRGFA